MEEMRTGIIEHEISGGAWDASLFIAFYAGVLLVLLTSLGVVPFWGVIVGLSLVFFSIFAIFSSPTYLRIEDGELFLDRTRLFINFTKSLSREEMEKIVVEESHRASQWEEDKVPERDISYFVNVYIKTKRGRIKAFQSSLSKHPRENRELASSISSELSSITGLQVDHVYK